MELGESMFGTSIRTGEGWRSGGSVFSRLLEVDFIDAGYHLTEKKKGEEEKCMYVGAWPEERWGEIR